MQPLTQAYVKQAHASYSYTLRFSKVNGTTDTALSPNEGAGLLELLNMFYPNKTDFESGVKNRTLWCIGLSYLKFPLQ